MIRQWSKTVVYTLFRRSSQKNLAKKSKSRAARRAGRTRAAFRLFCWLRTSTSLESLGITAEEIKLKHKGIFVPVEPVGAECAVCFNEQINPESLPCGHNFCSGCVTKLRQNNNCKCPLCRAPAPAAATSTTLVVQTTYEFLHGMSRKVIGNST